MTWMTMIPAYNSLTPLCLREHFDHLLLINRVDGFDTDVISALGKTKYIYDLNGIIIDELAQHEPHHFHRYPRTAMLQHFQKSQRRNVNLLGCVREGHFHAFSLVAPISAHFHHLLKIHHYIIDLFDLCFI